MREEEEEEEEGEAEQQQEEDVWLRIRRVTREAAQAGCPIPPTPPPVALDISDENRDGNEARQPAASSWDRGFMVSGRVAQPDAKPPSAAEASRAWEVTPSGFAISGRAAPPVPNRPGAATAEEGGYYRDDDGVDC